MHITFLNPQGNFDPNDSYWTEHPDFGGQLVYVKELAIAMAELGHEIDIVTRQIIDPDWPEFAAPVDAYPGVENVRILRIPCGPDGFLPKEQLWSYLGSEWVPNILDFYRREGRLPAALTTHYADGGLSGALIEEETGVPFTFTGHSLGAQKMDKLGASRENLAELDERYRFSKRIKAERIAMSRAGRIITSTLQERLQQYGHPAYRGAVDVRNNGRFVIIPPGANLRIFDASVISEGEAAVQAHIEEMIARDIDPERRKLPFVLASSRLDAKKNHLGLVQAFVQNQKLQDAANLAIVIRGVEDPLRDVGAVGGEEERAIWREIVALVEEHQLWGKITAFPLNSQAELAAAYRHLVQRHSVFCLTALHEPFGLAPLEAMAAGLPVVVTKHGGPAESLYDVETGVAYGVLVEPTDPSDIARGVLEVVAVPENWRYYHEAGRRRVREKYSWRRAAESYVRVIRAFPIDVEPIPAYFRNPAVEDVGVEELVGWYWGREA